MTENNGGDQASEKLIAVRWLPLACPRCRGIFRIKKSEIGHAVCCPLCDKRLLTADGPVVEIDHATTYATAKIADDSQEASKHEHGSGRKKHHAAGMQNSLDWEENEEPGELSTVSPMGVLTVVLIFLSLVGVGVYMWKVNVARAEKDAVERALLEDAMALPKALKDEVTGRDAGEIVAEEKEAGKLNEIASIDAVEDMTERIKNFLEAKTVQEKAKFVRDPERVLPLMKKYYERTPYEAEGFRQLGDLRELTAGNTVIATVVRVQDFTDYPIAAELKDGEWFVDWESWVGYSEMTIDELREKMPKDEVLVRVLLISENYFNYNFSKDEEWSSYRLRFKDSFEDLWGYVKKGSPQETAIVDQFQNKKEKAMRLKIKYPENPRNGDQVLITEVVGEGWLNMSDDKNKKE